MTEPVVAQEKPYRVDLKAGEKYAWCACGLSSKQPFCDGSHKTTDLKPTLFEAEQDETVALCGCKTTGNRPRCDGSHINL